MGRSIKTARNGAIIMGVLMLSWSWSAAGQTLLSPPEDQLTVSQDDIDRFVNLWLPRLNQEEWIRDYLNGTLQVQDEFQDASMVDKAILTQSLLDKFIETNDAMRDMIFSPDYNETQSGFMYNLSRGIVYMLAFDPVKLKEMLMGTVEGAQKPEQAEATEDRPSELFPGKNVTEIAKHFEDEKADMSSYKDLGQYVPEFEMLPKEQFEAVSDNPGAAPLITQYFAEEEKLDLTESIKPIELQNVDLEGYDVDTITLPALPELDIPLLPTEPRVQNTLDDLIRDATDLLTYVLGTATYQVCWRYPVSSATMTCDAIPALFLVPKAVDVTGDNIPDLMVTLAITPDPAIGVAVTFKTERIAGPNVEPVSFGPLPVGVYAVVQLPGAPESQSRAHAILGFESQDLARLFSQTLRVTDLVQGPMDFGFDLVTGDATKDLTMVGGVFYRRLVGEGVYESFDPTIAKVTFSPPPELLSIGLSQDFATVLEEGQATQATILGLDLTSSAPTKMTVAFSSQTAGVGRAMLLVADQLPTSLKANIQISGGASLVSYDASAVIDNLSFADQQIPDLRQANTFDLLQASVMKLPESFEISTDRNKGEDRDRFTYSSSAVVPKVTFQNDKVRGGTTVERTQVTVTDIPTELTFERRSVGGVQTFELKTDVAIGRIDYLAWTGQGTPVRLSGDHFLDLTQVKVAADGSAGVYRVTSAVLSGLKSIKAALDDTNKAVRFDLGLRGGQSFQASIRKESTDARSGSSDSLRSDFGISNLPSTIHVEIQDGRMLYQASTRIARVDASVTQTKVRGGDVETSRATFAVDSIPTQIEVLWSTKDKSVRYAASDNIARITLGIDRSKSSTMERETFLGVIEDLPRTIKIAWDEDRSQLLYEADTRIRLIDVSLRTQKGPKVNVITGRVDGLPARLLASWDQSTGILFDASQPIDRITFGTANADSIMRPAFSGDHVYAVVNGGYQSMSARISGFQHAFADLQDQAFHVKISGRQPFLAGVAKIDPSGADLAVSAYLSNLPGEVTIQLSGSSFLYRASEKIGQLNILACEGDGSVYLPTAGCNVGAAKRAVYASVSGLPTQIAVDVGKRGAVEATVNMDSPVGSISFGATELGYFPSVWGSDYVVGVEAGAGRAVGARISGVEDVLVETGTGHVVVDMTAGHPLTVQFQRANGDFIGAQLSNLPGRIVLDFTLPNSVTYKAENVINVVTGFARIGDMVASVIIEGVPRLISIYNDPSVIQFHTSSAIRRVAVQVQKGASFYANVDAYNIIQSARVDLATRSIALTTENSFGPISATLISGPNAYVARVSEVPGGIVASYTTQPNGEKVASLVARSPINFIWAAATNDGIISTMWGDQRVCIGCSLYLPPADHMYARLTGGSVRASFMITGLQSVVLRQSGDLNILDATLRGGQTMYLYALNEENNQRMLMNGYISNFPDSIHLEIGKHFLYSANRNINIYLYAEIGSTWVLPSVETPYVTHGIVVRAGSLSPIAAKVQIYLTGLPTYFFANTGRDGGVRQFVYRNFNPDPWLRYIIVDAKIPRLEAFLRYDNIPRDLDLTIDQGDKRSCYQHSANADSGPITVDVAAQLDWRNQWVNGRLEISNIPAYLRACLEYLSGGFTLTYDASNVINRIWAGFRASLWGDWSAYAYLLQIPTYVRLTVGDNDEDGAPYFSYTANADTLDIGVGIKAELFGGWAHAALTLAINDLGRSTSSYKWGSYYILSSYPYTRSIYIGAQAYFGRSWSTGGGGSFLCGWGICAASWGWSLGASIYAGIRDISVYTEYLSSISLAVGYPLEFGWVYANFFTFSWSGIQIGFNIYANAYLNLLVWTVISIGFSFGINILDISLLFHKWLDQWWTLFYFSYTFGWICWPEVSCGWRGCSWRWHCLYVWVRVDVKPNPDWYYSWNSFTLYRCGCRQWMFAYLYVNWFGFIPPMWLWWVEYLYMFLKHGGISFSGGAGWT